MNSMKEVTEQNYDIKFKAQVQYRLAQACKRSRNFKRAEEYYKEALVLMSDIDSTFAFKIHIELAEIAVHASNINEAIKHYEVVLIGEQNAENISYQITAHLQLAILLQKNKGNRAEIIQHLQDVITVEPEHPDANFYLAEILSNSGGDLDEVMYFFLKGSSSSNYELVLSCSIMMKLSNKDLREVVKVGERYIKGNLCFVEYALAFGNMQGSERYLERIEVYLEEAFSRAQYKDRAHLCHARALMQLKGDLTKDKAIATQKHLQQMLINDPRNEKALRYLYSF